MRSILDTLCMHYNGAETFVERDHSRNWMKLTLRSQQPII